MVSKIILGAFVQTRPKFGQNEENIEDAIRLASKVKSDIYVFPELCNTGYAFRSKRECHSLAESLRNGNSVEQFQSFTEKRKCTIVAGLAEKDGEKTYNSSIVVERGKILGTYRKMHLFFREKIWFSKSNSGFKTFSLETLGCRIGVLICFDWFFPEASRKLTMDGAEVICHSADLVLPGKAQLGMMATAFRKQDICNYNKQSRSREQRPKRQIPIHRKESDNLSRDEKTCQRRHFRGDCKGRKD